MMKDHKGNIWIGTANGLDRLSKKMEENESKEIKFNHYKNESNDPKSLSSNVISSLCVRENGDLWVGTYNQGINIYNPNLNEFIRIAGHRRDH